MSIHASHVVIQHLNIFVKVAPRESIYQIAATTPKLPPLQAYSTKNAESIFMLQRSLEVRLD